MPKYNEIIMDHFQNPQNVGEFENADGIGLEQNPVCGDKTQIWIQIRNDLITDIRFKTQGCAAAIATSSVCTVNAKGMGLQEAKNLSANDVANWAGGLPRAKIHCSVLAEDAIKAAIRDYQQKNA